MRLGGGAAPWHAAEGGPPSVMSAEVSSRIEDSSKRYLARQAALRAVLEEAEPEVRQMLERVLVLRRKAKKRARANADAAALGRQRRPALPLQPRPPVGTSGMLFRSHWLCEPFRAGGGDDGDVSREPLHELK